MAKKGKQATKIQSRIWFFSLVESENDIPKILENLKECTAVNCFTIRHDKDKILMEDGTIIPKAPHWHFAIRYENPTTINVLAKYFELAPNDWHYIQKAKSWKVSCRYLLHMDQPEKHRYKNEEIVCIKSSLSDYFDICSGRVQTITSDLDLFPNFCKFDIEPYKKQVIDIHNLVDDVKARSNLLELLKKSYNQYLDKRAFEMENKKVKVIFVQGATGSGKSTFAKSLAINTKASYCISSSSNDVMQDYSCEDYLILDDLRDTTFSFEDLLKLLDNFVVSTIKSRYRNKMFLGEYIVITSAKPLCEWYKDTKEDRKQLFRRINMFAECERKGNSLIANVYVYPNNQTCINENGKPNGIAVPTPIMELTPQTVLNVEETWKALGIDLEELAKKIVEPIQKTFLEEIDDDESHF